MGQVSHCDDPSRERTAGAARNRRSRKRSGRFALRCRAPMFYAIGLEHTLEIIAGGLEGDDPHACVQREAREEAGLKIRALDHVLTGMSMPGVSTMRLDLYLASYREE